MLPHSYRLPLRQELGFFAHARREHSPLFTCFYKPSEGGFQVAVIVPKKVASHASKRNALRRQVAQELLILLPSLKCVSLKLVIALKPAAAQVECTELRMVVRTLVQKIAGIKPE